MERRGQFEFSAFEIELLRQWFNALEDLNLKYLVLEDYALAEKIAGILGTPPPVYRGRGGGLSEPQP